MYYNSSIHTKTNTMTSLYKKETTALSSQEAVASLKASLKAIKAAGGIKIPTEMTLNASESGYVKYKVVNNDFMGNFNFYVQANGGEWEAIEQYWVLH
jgi:hypothetical protein